MGSQHTNISNLNLLVSRRALPYPRRAFPAPSAAPPPRRAPGAAERTAGLFDRKNLARSSPKSENDERLMNYLTRFSAYFHKCQSTFAEFVEKNANRKLSFLGWSPSYFSDGREHKNVNEEISTRIFTKQGRHRLKRNRG